MSATLTATGLKKENVDSVTKMTPHFQANYEQLSDKVSA
jgi:hypothetical protein